MGLYQHKNARDAAKFRQSVTTISATIGSFGLGNVLGWTSPALPKLQENGDFQDISTNDLTWIASIAILGALLSGPIAGVLINQIGRRGTMRLLSLPFGFGWFLMACAIWYPICIYLGRFITGLCGGAFTVIVPVYVSEVVEEEFRGTLGTLMVLMLVSGILFSFVCGAILSWFWLSIICGIFPFCLFFAMLFAPESPQYLQEQNCQKKAEKTLRWLRGFGESKSPSINVDHAKNNSTELEMSDVYANHKTCFNLCYLNCGINSVTMYTVDIFKSASDTVDPNLASIAIGIVQVVFVALSMVLVDKIGRKQLLIVSSFMMGLSLTILGIFFYLKEQNDGNTLNALTWVPMFTLIAFIIAYSFGMGPIPWLMVSELLNPEFKSEISATITFVYWTLAFVTTKTFQDMIILFRESGCYWIFGSICFFTVLFTCFFVPETKGKSSIEIRKYFGDASGDKTSVELCHLEQFNETELPQI